MKNTNIGYWEKVLENPTLAYQELITAEHAYLVEKTPQGSTVLDVGCGDGRNIETVLQKTKDIVGIDNDDIAVNHAKKKFLNTTTVKIIKGDASQLPFADETFDVVIFFDLLQNLDLQKEKALLEVKRVMKRNGFILLCTYSENASSERNKMYEIINVPIKKRQESKIFFEESVGANVSEQFSLSDIEKLANKADLKITESKRVGNLAYLCTLKIS